MRVEETQNGVRFEVRTVPKSKSNVLEIQDDFIKLRIQSPPVDGKANEGIVRFLSKKFNVKKNDVKIIKGRKNRLKLIEIKGINIKDFYSNLKLEAKTL